MRKWLLLPLSLFFVTSNLLADSDSESFTAVEKNDRNADRTALLAYRGAANDLKNLIQRRPGDSTEPALLMKLANTLTKAAAVEYRVAHADQKNAVDLTAYKDWNRQILSPLTRLIEVYPNDNQVPIAYFLRAKAHKELGNRNDAIKGYRYMVDRYPKSSEVKSATLSLFELWVEIKEYKLALDYLGKLSPNERAIDYTLITEKMAWASYYLNDIAGALKYLEKVVAVLRSRTTKGKADLIELDTALTNIVLFFSTGMDQKKPEYVVPKALPYFQTLSSGSDLTRMVVSYAYQLRTRAFDEGLETFKQMVVGSDPNPVDSVELLCILLGYQQNKHRYAQVKSTSWQILSILEKHIKILEEPRLKAKVEKSIGEVAFSLQTEFTNNQPSLKPGDSSGKKAEPPQEKGKPPELSKPEQIAHALISVYRTMLRLTEDPSALEKLYHNLAEISFRVREFADATDYYRKVVAIKGFDSPSGHEAQLKAIGARYELFRTQGLIPGQITARPLKKAEQKELPKPVSEWLGWIQECFHTKQGKTNKDLQVFAFEANRVLYSRGFLREAVDHLIEFAKLVPESPYAIPSAALVIDTYIASEDWKQVAYLITGYLKYPAWMQSNFHKKLVGILTDTEFKILEEQYKSGEYSTAIASVDRFVKAYPGNPRITDCLAIAGNSALALKDRKRAIQFFSPLLAGNKINPEVASIALLTQASLSEEEYDFSTAADQYIRYLEMDLSSKDLNNKREIAKKALFLSWLSGRPDKLKRILATPRTCDKDLPEECDRFKAILALSEPRASYATKAKMATVAFYRAPLKNRIFWAVLGAYGFKNLTRRDRNAFSSEILSSWDKQDSIPKLWLLPHIASILPYELKSIRDGVRGTAKIRPDPSTIKKRTKQIELAEAELDRFELFPLLSLKAAAMNERANLYMDFSQDLTDMANAKGLSKEDRELLKVAVEKIRSSFENKGKTLRKKAFDLASNAAADPEIFGNIASLYFQEFPTEIASYKDIRGLGQGVHISTTSFDEIDKNKGWTSSGVPQNLNDLIKKKLFLAVSERNWPFVAFLLQEGKRLEALNPVQLTMVRAVSMVLTGARPEGINELREIKTKIDSRSRASLLMILISQYTSSLSKENAKKLMEEFAESQGEISPAFKRHESWLTKVLFWSNAKVPQNFRESLVTPRTPAGNIKGAQK